MATAYKTDAATAGVPATYRPGAYHVPFTFTIPAAGLIVNDTLRFINIPAGSNFLNLYLSHPDLETGGPTLVVNIGDSNAATTFVGSGTTTFRSAFDDWITACTAFAAQSIPAVYAAADYVYAKIATAAGTSPTSGAIKGFAVMYSGAGGQKVT